MITNVGLSLLRDALKGDVTDCEIKYIAWGDGAAALAVTDTQLQNELGRHAVTSQVAGAAGILDTIIYLGPADAVATITRIGFFAGVGATAAANSGVMVAEFAYSKTKTALFSLQLNLRDTVMEA
jgi:hypothetical protein